MKPALGQTRVTLDSGGAGNEYIANANSGDFSNGDNAQNRNFSTYALAQVSGGETVTHTWTFPTIAADASRSLRVVNEVTGSGNAGVGALTETTNPGDLQDLSSAYDRANMLIEYSTDAGVTWAKLYSVTDNYPRRSHSKLLSDGLDLTTAATLQVRITFSGLSGDCSARVFSVHVESGGQALRTVQVGLAYFVTEVYIDSDGQEHESLPTELSDEIAAGSTAYSISVHLPASPNNSFATHYRIYRSIDEQGGGYPLLYAVGETTDTSDTVWVDSLESSLVSIADKGKTFDFVTVTYWNGAQLDFASNRRPPLSKLALNYQGSVVYLPVDTPRKVWYSLPTSLGENNAGKVPAIYYLEFLTEANDAVQSAALANGGKSLIVYFTNYTMNVNFLPQAGDGGRFDNRVSDFVSQSRGAVGTHATATFTPEDGASTVAASVDSIGLWITDGIGTIRNWSKDYDWGALSTYNLSTSQLVNNPEMRRLEFLYDTGSGWEEIYFYYGELKQNGQPKITGPHKVGFRCKTYSEVSGNWVGWSGDDRNGEVYAERVGYSDGANGYDASGNIPFVTLSGDVYEAGLKDAGLVNFVYPKFDERDLYDKDVDVTGVFNRDGRQTAVEDNNPFNLLTGKKVYFHRYADRYQIGVEDISTTALPALLGFESDVRKLDAEGMHGEE